VPEVPEARLGDQPVQVLRAAGHADRALRRFDERQPEVALEPLPFALEAHRVVHDGGDRPAGQRELADAGGEVEHRRLPGGDLDQRDADAGVVGDAADQRGRGAGSADVDAERQRLVVADVVTGGARLPRADRRPPRRGDVAAVAVEREPLQLGAAGPLTKELVAVAVSAVNACHY
jgi:hypothetical protein